MLRRPKLKGHVTIFPLSPARWRVSGGLDELSRIELRNELAIEAFGRLLPLLDGRKESAGLVDQLEQQGANRGAVEALLRHLEQAGLLEEADDHGLSAEDLEAYEQQIRYLGRFTSEGGAKFQARLRRSRVVIVDGCAGRLTEELRRTLLAVGVGEVEVCSDRQPASGTDERPAESPACVTLEERQSRVRVHAWRATLSADPRGLPDLIVVGLQAHDPVLLESMDAFAKQTRVPWLLVRCVSAEEGWVGPLFVPFDTASYASLEARLQANLPHAEDYRSLGEFVRDQGGPAAGYGGLVSNFSILAGIAASEVAKQLSGFAVPQLAGRFLSIHFGTWVSELHDVLRVPHLERPEPGKPLAFPWQDGHST